MNNFRKISTRNSYKLQTPCRTQVSMDWFCLDDLIPETHRARKVWAFVEQLESNRLYDRLRSFQGGTGRAAVCPKVLLALWLYAIIDGVSSGRRIAELAKNHSAYRWIAGGTGVNRDNINSFRSQKSEVFEEILTECIAGLLSTGLIEPEDLAQDGTRVVALAGKGTYRREQTLAGFLEVSKLYLRDLLQEEKRGNYEMSARQKAARLRGAREQVERIQEALEAIERHRETKSLNNLNNGRKPLGQKERENVRASYSDPDARKMLMPNGGWKIGYNIQFATGVKSKIIYGVETSSSGNDAGKLLPMILQVSQKMEKLGVYNFIRGWTADSGYSYRGDIEEAGAMFPDLPMALAPRHTEAEIPPEVPRKNDTPAIARWRQFLKTEEYEELYAGRAPSAEFSNMTTKTRGMGRLLARGLTKVHNTCLLFALAHNLMCSWNL